MTADLVFTLVDVISILTLLGCIAFGLFRRDLLMFVACLGLIALTRGGAQTSLSHSPSPALLHRQPISSDEFSMEWFGGHTINLLHDAETIIRADLNRSVFIAMFVMILFATLFEGTATNHEFQLSDAYSQATTRRKFVKTRFFIGWTMVYTALALGVATIIDYEWHMPLLEILPAEEAFTINAWLIPAAHRLIFVLHSTYFRELVLLMTLICYDQDANTSISFSVIIAFIPSLALSLARQALSVLQTDGAMVPSYLIWDASAFDQAISYGLLAAHLIMYLAWIKTLRDWFAEQDLFKMRYNVLAEKYNRDVTLASAEAISKRSTGDASSEHSSGHRRNPSSSLVPPSSAANPSTGALVTPARGGPLGANTPTPPPPSLSMHGTTNTDLAPLGRAVDGSASADPHRSGTSGAGGVKSSASTRPSQAKVRKLSADSQAATPKLGQFPEVRKSVQNLVSGGLVSLEARGQSTDSSSMVSVYQQKIGTPTIIPFDDGTECFSYVGKSILLWNLKTHQIQNSFVGHTQPVSKIKAILVPEGENPAIKERRLPGSPLSRANILISASWDGSIKLWEIATAKCLATLEGDMGGITCINTYDNDTKLIAGSNQGLIKLWDLRTQQVIDDSYQQSPVTISAIGVYQDCSKFFAVSFDGCAYIWNLATKRCEKILKKHKKRILDAQIYDSDTRLITASEDCSLIIWDLEKGTHLRTLEGHSSAVQVVAVYGDSQRAISGSTDGQLIAWDICTEDIAQFIVSSLDDHTAAIISIHVFEAELNKMYTHSMDRKLRIWDMAANICEETIDMPPANEQDTQQREDTGTSLNILVAWTPTDSLSLQSTEQFIKLQGHSIDVCKSSDEFLLKFMAPNARYHIVLIDLELPGLSGLDTQPVAAHFTLTGAKLVLLTTPDVHLHTELPDVVATLKVTPGFMELTEKPLMELTLAKILHEVAFSVHLADDWIADRSEEFSLDDDETASSSNSNISNGSDLVFASSSSSSRALIQRGDSSSFLDGTHKSQMQNMHDRLSYVENLFACFVPVQFFEMISPKGRDRTQLGDAVCRSVTVLFSDIRDFSTMSESMAVSELMEFLNAYLAFAMPPIQENGGFVDKFIGDSIMALFSQDGTQQCISAVNCAISMMYHLDGLQDNGFTQVNTGIGINTGRMIIGLVGVETRMEPTVLGDAVNLASRLESLCKVYDSRVIISEYTRERMGRSVELYTMRELDLVAVKGKKLACKIYEILEAERKEPGKGKRLLLKDGLWDRALTAFRKGEFQQALALFDQCQALYPQDRATKLYIQRCNEAMAKGVDAMSWDSTHRLVTK